MISLLYGSTNYIRANVVDPNGAKMGGGTVTVTLIETSSGNQIVAAAQMSPVVGQSAYNYEYVAAPAVLLISQGVLYSVEVIATFGAVVIRKRETVEVYE